MKRIILACAILVLALAGILWWGASSQKSSLSKGPGDPLFLLSPGGSARIAAARSHRPDAAIRWPQSPFAARGTLLAEATVGERRRLNDHLLAQSAGALLDLWFQQARGKQDSLRLDFIAAALSFQLRKEQSQAAALIARMAAFARDPGQDDFLRWQMVETLGEVATRDAVEALVDLARFAEDHPNLQPIVLRQIARVGEVRWDGRFHEELSPALEKLWSEGGTGQSLDEAVSMGLAGIGAPSAVQLLLRDVSSGGRSINEFERSGGTRAWIAMEALDLIRNVQSVPVLAGALAESQPGDVQMLAAGQALAGMGRPEATTALLEWAQSARQDVGGFVESWISKMRDQTSVDLVSGIAAKGIFANLANQRALQKALSEWRAYRS